MVGSIPGVWSEDFLHCPVGDPSVVEDPSEGPVPERLVEGQRGQLGVEPYPRGTPAAGLRFQGLHEAPADSEAPLRRAHRDPLGLAVAVQEAKPGRPDRLLAFESQEVEALGVETILLLVARHLLLLDEDLEAQGEAGPELLGPGDANAKHRESLVQHFDIVSPMNFLGHAVVAAAQDDAPEFVLGAMLPDLAAMAGFRFREVRAAEPAAGVTLHHRTDAVFHSSRDFVQLARETMAGLTGAGMRRGPARAVAHVGVELMLDGWWVREHGVPGSYRRALDAASDVEPHLVWRGEVEDASLTRGCTRIAELDVAGGYADPAFVAQRLTRIFARRPRLALRGEEPQMVRDWTLDARSAIDASAPRLLREIGEGLGMASWYPPAP